MRDELLHAYFDGELGPAEVAEVEQALRTDPALAEGLRRIAEVHAALGTLPGCIPSTDTVVIPSRRGRLLRILLPLAAAAGLLLAFMGQGGAGGDETFEIRDHLDYVWEADADTFGSLALNDSELEAKILEELRST